VFLWQSRPVIVSSAASCASTWASIARHAQGHEAAGRPAKLKEDGYGFIESLAEQEAWSGSGRLTHDSVSFLPTICGIPFPLRDIRPRKFVESFWPFRPRYSGTGVFGDSGGEFRAGILNFTAILPFKWRIISCCIADICQFCLSGVWRISSLLLPYWQFAYLELEGPERSGRIDSAGLQCPGVYLLQSAGVPAAGRLNDHALPGALSHGPVLFGLLAGFVCHIIAQRVDY
jgi:hypothetical protein